MAPSSPPLPRSNSSFKAKLVQPFITRALLTIDRVSVSSPTSTGLHIDVDISLTRCGALAAEIQFVDGFQLWSSEAGTIGGTDELLVAVAGKESTSGCVTCKDGVGKGKLKGHIELQGRDGASWIDRVVRMTGPVPTSILAPISIKIKAAHIRCSDYSLRRSFSLDGLGGFDGACLPTSSVALGNVKAAPMSTNKEGVALYADLPLRNPSKQLSLSLGRLVCTIQKREGSTQGMGSATVDALELPPSSTSTLRVKILFHYGAIAEAAGASLFGMLVRDTRLSGLQLVIKGEHKLGNEGEEPIEADWLRDLLDRTPIHINFPDTLKIVQGVTFGSSWL